MKNKENKIIKALSAAVPELGKCNETEDFCPFDVECDMYIIEIKSREKAYDPWIIERMKAEANVNIVESLKKHFLYLTEHLGTAYVWNITKLIRQDYDFNWTSRPMPWTTEFEQNKSISKEVGYLYQNLAKEIKLWTKTNKT